MKIEPRPKLDIDAEMAPVGTITTPKASVSIALCGIGMTRESVILSRDEFRRLQSLYVAADDARSPLHHEGMARNVMRYAEADGVRIVAWLAKYVSPGKDPLKTIVQMAIDSGFDVEPADVEWCEE